MKKTKNVRYASCIVCNKKFTKDQRIRHGLCLDCMAFLVESIDIDPHDDYPVFIDFAYRAEGRLSSGEDLETIFEDIPDGFEEWLVNNAKKAGFGITSNQIE